MKQNEKGISLIEVIASIVIISIILLSIAPLIIRSNVMATYNNEKLATIDLAQTVLERLRVEKDVVKQVVKSGLADIEIPLDEIGLTGLKVAIETNDHNKIYILETDNQTYQVEAYVKPCNEEPKSLGMNLVFVKVNRVEITPDESGVHVKKLTGNSEIEGFVEL